MHDSSTTKQRGFLPLAIGTAVISIFAKVTLLPFPISSAGEFLRWLLRLGVVVSADICFIIGLTVACTLLCASVKHWPRVWTGCRLLCCGMFYLAGLYTVACVPLFKATRVPFTVQFLAFAGSPGLMASSIEEYVTPASVGILAVGPVVLLLAGILSRRLPALQSVHASRWATAAATLLISLYSFACQAYVHARWTDPNRWERRIAQSPHAVLLSSCIDELLKKQPFTYEFSFDEVDLSDFTAATESHATVWPEGKRPKNVLVIAMESVGAEYIDFCGGKYQTMPHLARLAAEQGVIFDNYYVQAPNSCKSLCALVTSTHPRPDWRILSRDDPDFSVPMISEVLAGEGYRTCYAHSGFWSWRGRDRYFNRNASTTLIDAERLPGKFVSSWGVSDRSMYEAVLDWIEEQPERPFFALAFTIETHHPYTPPPSDGKDQADKAHDFAVADPELGRYLNALRRADEHIAWVMEELARRGLAESTLVAITGDHGESFGHNGERGHSFSMYQPTVRVPLVLLNPGLKDFPRRVSAVRQQIDFAPTMMEMLDLPPPSDWQGRHLLREGDGPVYFSCSGHQLVLGLRDGDFKYHYYLDTAFEELFNLADDPGEQNNLAAVNAEKCVVYRRRIGGFVHHQRDFLRRHGAD
jgi:phosphoglycerol transferase MdoB-like AlkP superfamily enzyme